MKYRNKKETVRYYDLKGQEHTYEIDTPEIERDWSGELKFLKALQNISVFGLFIITIFKITEVM